jgi:hypothetical protein
MYWIVSLLPIDANEVFLDAAERFDVLVTIPDNAKVGVTSWIKAYR